MTRYVIVLAVSLAVAGGTAAAVQAKELRLQLSGRVTPAMRAWTKEASVNVPMPPARLTIRNGSPMTLGTTIVLPFAWGAFTVHGLFLHELGHVYDRSVMTPARRLAFLRAAGVTCRWKAAHCRTARWVSGPGVVVDVRPEEMFAEMYAACALGLTERGYQDAGYNTYGWVPPDGADAALCAVIRGR